MKNFIKFLDLLDFIPVLGVWDLGLLGLCTFNTLKLHQIKLLSASLEQSRVMSRHIIGLATKLSPKGPV